MKVTLPFAEGEEVVDLSPYADNDRIQFKWLPPPEWEPPPWMTPPPGGSAPQMGESQPAGKRKPPPLDPPWRPRQGRRKAARALSSKVLGRPRPPAGPPLASAPDRAIQHEHAAY